jgi:ABC-type transporter MlaC component
MSMSSFLDNKPSKQEALNQNEARKKVEDLNLDSFSLLKNNLNKISMNLVRAIIDREDLDNKDRKIIGKALLFVQTITEETSREDYDSFEKTIQEVPDEIVSKEDKDRILGTILIARPNI